MIDIMNLYGYIARMSIDPAFTAVPRQRQRHDGWTAQRQRAFIDALGEYGMVRAAAEKVGMSAASAYRLREADGAASFAAAWDRALRRGMANLVDIAMDRAVNGTPVPHFYKGQQVGEARFYDNRLLMFMLRHAVPQTFGRYAPETELAERAERAQAETEAKRLEQLERAEALLAGIESVLEEIAASHPQMEADAQHDLVQKRDRLISIIEQLRHVDTVRAAEASIDQLVATGRYSQRHGNIFKARLHKSAVYDDP